MTLEGYNDFMKLLALTFALLSPTLLLNSAQATPLEGTYIGSVGTAPVVAVFGAADAQFENSYYYRKFGQDIQLEQREKNGQIVLTEFGPFPEQLKRATATLKLEDGQLSGTYTLLKGGKPLPMTLKPVSSADLKGPLSNPQLESWKKKSPYTFLKFDRKLEAGKFVSNSSTDGKMVLQTGKLSGVTYTWTTEPKSKISYPRLEGSIYQQVNSALEGHQLEVAANVLECNVTEPDHSFNFVPTLSFISAKLVSVTAAVDLYCGGAHPTTYTDTLTLELVSGKALELEDVYRFVPLPAGVNLKTFEPFEKYDAFVSARKKTLEPLIYAVRPDLKKNTDCYGPDTGIDSWKTLYWWLSNKGLVLESDFPHVAAACTEAVTLPYALLEKYRVSKLRP